MRRAISPAICTQVTSPRALWIRSALRSFSVEALSRSALTKLPGVYQTPLTSPSTGLLFECTLNTFMNTLIFSASRSRYSSRTFSTETMRPSAGEITASGSAGGTRAGSRKNCSANTAQIQNGIDHQPMSQVAIRAAANAASKTSQPSRAMRGCVMYGKGKVSGAGFRVGIQGKVRGVVATPGGHLGVVGLAFQDEALGIGAVLDVGQGFLHRGARLLVDDLDTGHVLAVFRIVGARVVHVGDAAFVHQVDDQLQLVQTLEVGHLGGVTRLDQGIKASLDQLHGAAAQHGLLAEQVGR